MTELEILQGAHALLSKGWIQDADFEQYGDGRKAFCLRGAVHEMSGFDKVKQRLGETIFALFPGEEIVRDSKWMYEQKKKRVTPLFWDGVITSFNDRPGRRKKDILRVLEVAIADEQARLAEFQKGGVHLPELQPVLEEVF